MTRTDRLISLTLYLVTLAAIGAALVILGWGLISTDRSPDAEDQPPSVASTSAPMIWERANGEVCIRYPETRCAICVDAELQVIWRNQLLLEMDPEQCQTPTP